MTNNIQNCAKCGGRPYIGVSTRMVVMRCRKCGFQVTHTEMNIAQMRWARGFVEAAKNQTTKQGKQGKQKGIE